MSFIMAVEDETEPVVLSKSQKKRMKQKASKAKKAQLELEKRLRKEASAESAEESSSDGSYETDSDDDSSAGFPSMEETNGGPKLDINVSLVSDLEARGYAADDIQAVQGELWERMGSGEGGYDDPAAVEEALLERKRQNVGREEESDDDGSSYETESDEEDDEDSGVYEDEGSFTSNKKTDVEENSDTAATALSTPTPSSSQQQDEDDKASISSSGGDGAGVVTRSASRKRGEKPLEKRSLSTKLRYVALDVPNLGDALFALTEWTTKAATRTEVEVHLLEMANNGNSSGVVSEPKTLKEGIDGSSAQEGVLRTILGRVLLPSDDTISAGQANALVPAAAALVTAVLLGPACNARIPASNGANGSSSGVVGPVAHSAAMKKAMGEALRRGRALVLHAASSVAVVANDNGEHLEGEAAQKEIARALSKAVLDMLRRAADEKATKEETDRRRRETGSSDNGVASSSVAVEEEFENAIRAEEAVRRMEKEMDAVATGSQSKGGRPRQQTRRGGRSGSSSKAGAGAEVADLMAKRDGAKVVAEKGGAVLGIAAGCKRRLNEAPHSSSAPSDGDDDGDTEDAAEKIDNVDEGQVGAEGDGAEDEEHRDDERRGLLQTNEGKETFIENLLGNGLQSAVSASIQKVQTMESEMEQTLAEASLRKEELTTRRDEVVAERQQITSQMDALRKELEELEAQEEQLSAEEEKASKELVRTENKSESRAAELRSQIEARASDVAVDREVRRAVDKLGEFELAWILSSTAPTTSPAAAAASPPPQEVSPEEALAAERALANRVPGELGRYLTRARAYFRVEADCIEFLRGRVVRVEAEVVDLEHEVRECAALGMATNVENMNQNLRTLKTHVDEDNVVVEALMCDAKAMRSDLIRRMDSYGTFEDTEVTSLHVSILEGISIALKNLGFDDDDDGGLGDIFATIPERNKIAVKDVVNGDQDSNTLPVTALDSHSYGDNAVEIDASPITNGHAPAVPIPAPLVKPVIKFSWASGGWGSKAVAVKTDTKSLLDIQKEEMSAKGNGKSG